MLNATNSTQHTSESSSPSPAPYIRDNYLEFKGRTFAPAKQVPIPEWPCTSIERQQPTLTLKNNDLFLITDTLGNIPGCLQRTNNTSLGLFCQDTRFLSRLEWQIEGEPLILLSSSADRGFALSALCANPYVANIHAETISIKRDLVLQGGLFEELTLTNYGKDPIEFELSLSFNADFADLFEIRGSVRQQTGTILRPIHPPARYVPDTTELVFNETSGSTGDLILAYQGLDKQIVESRITFYDRKPDGYKGYTALWKFELDSHETQKLGYKVQPVLNDEPASYVAIPATLRDAIAEETAEVQEWRDRSTRIITDNRALNQIIERAEEDIYLLMQSFGDGDGKILSAGIPWYSTLFGRDSIIAAMQTLIFNPDIARQTLAILAQYQGKEYNPAREEEPGKILHELRRGEMARCSEIPHTPYYGTVDATPLWLMLYADYYAWTGDRQFLDRYWDCALAAMEWIDNNSGKTGYLTYQGTLSEGFTSLINQGWKDSTDCIVFADGTLAEGPIALAEVQGYMYAAKLRMSRLARVKSEQKLGDRWANEAQLLKQRFETDFWLPEKGFFALALDGDRQAVDSISSNPGHCLGLGLFSEEKAEAVADRLRQPDMFNGWGIRTLSSDSPAYNPMGYHIGSVWPHDTSIIASGLRAMDFTDQALEVAQGLIDMTVEQPYNRPPELFCGFERTPNGSPVRYPVACSPQAWATGTVFQLLHLIVNLVPDTPGNCLRIVNPMLPSSVKYLSLKNLKIGNTFLDLEFEQANGATACRVVRKEGRLRVVIEA
ncbi:amylo-alpha-1,6-glucosidase [Roseofilum casamattae]|uniref:Amylo-alpha-1,6-glucosidase n=1 Tax=Roseofilum casamattae BLCC-M143 TaxID=3022442 RepID=A0ABT7BWZ7_9CYAN|nr:amylo-alpha-1,6-glucosidase [Roseofilum casamattae]MDJ1183691.1 amylo-alpha-1,6-glucosidase [Roseofilum casamattae BLCC-M143]